MDVSVSIIGNPSVLFLEEPSTGMHTHHVTSHYLH
jgi:ABC-type multidrug transport system ATPase subunit